MERDVLVELVQEQLLKRDGDIALQCVITYMNSERESRIPMTAWSSAAEVNCVVARRGGEQPEAELWA